MADPRPCDFPNAWPRRALSLWLATVLWAGSLAAQETVAVTALVSIPDFLWLTAEPETVVGREEEQAVMQVRLHVKANRTWTLLVGCGTDAGPAEDGSLDGEDDAVPHAPAARWRSLEAGGPLRPFQPCSTGEPAAAAEGGRGNDTLVVLEYVAPRAAAPLLYSLVAR